MQRVLAFYFARHEDVLAGYPAGAAWRRTSMPWCARATRHRGEQGIPGREFFRRGDPRAYHLHLSAHEGEFWRKHLAFRDALRTMPSVRDAYAAIKAELAQRFSRDRQPYIEGKTAFVRRVINERMGRAE